MHLFVIKLINQHFICLAEDKEGARQALIDRYHDELAEYIDTAYVKPEHFQKIHLDLDRPGAINLP